MQIKDGTFKADDKTVDSEKKEEAENAKAISGKANERTNGNAEARGRHPRSPQISQKTAEVRRILRQINRRKAVGR